MSKMFYTADKLEAQLLDLLRELDMAEGDDVGISRVDTFRERGVLTRDCGLVINTSDGREWQLTIVRSR